MKIIFKNGAVKEATIHHVKGAPENPMTEEELKDKFRANTKAIFKASRVDKIIDAVLNLEKLPSVSSLTKMLSYKRFSILASCFL